MNELHSLLFQKVNRTISAQAIATDLLDSFGFVCTSIDFPQSGKTKEVTTTSWKDRDGEDAYIPSAMRVEAFDLKIGVCYSGKIGESEAKLRLLIDFLRTGLPADGSGMMIWSELYKRGFCKCYLKDVSDTDYTYLTHNEVLECSLTFRVTDPTTIVKVSSEVTEGKTNYYLTHK